MPGQLVHRSGTQNRSKGSQKPCFALVFVRCQRVRSSLAAPSPLAGFLQVDAPPTFAARTCFTWCSRWLDPPCPGPPEAAVVGATEIKNSLHTHIARDRHRAT